MERLDVAERGRVVALVAECSELPFVNLRFGVANTTTETIGWPRLERDRGVAIRALGGQVRAVKLELRLGVVIEDVLAGFQVALLALVAEPLAVGVIFGVTTLASAVGRDALVLLAVRMSWMTVDALGNRLVKTE